MKVQKPHGYTVEIEAGTYFLGDPCYAVPDEQWMPLLLSCHYFACEGEIPDANPALMSPVGTIGDQHVLGFSTAYGDGTYRDQHGTEYSVDAGLIGLTPAAVFEGRVDPEELERLGAIVTFIHDVTATSDGEGRLRFGEFVIDTNQEDEEEDEYGDDDYAYGRRY